VGSEIETLGSYQIHLLALEVATPPGWDAYLTVTQFRQAAQDFIPVLEKFSVPGGPFPDEATAIDAARVLANTLLERGQC
jgi:hypothetical protein